MNKFSEKDWKLFRKKISGWQEAYMEKLNREYIAFSDDLKDMLKRIADN